MDFLEILNQYGIYLLTVIYFGINLYYNNCFNLLIFFIFLFISFNVISSIKNAFIIAYIFSIIIGIVKNFHLLENFSDNININNKINKKINKKSISEIDIEKDDTIKMLNSNKIQNIKTQRNNKAINIKDIVSDFLLKKYIQKLKTENIYLIQNKKINIESLKPTLGNLDSNKIKSFKNSINNNKMNLMNSIIISNDYFIIDGHHRWFTRKTFINDNLNANNKKEQYNQYINVIMIDYKISKIIEDLKEFKDEYNNKQISSFNFDNNKINQAKRCIKNIKKDINALENYYKDLEKISLA